MQSCFLNHHHLCFGWFRHIFPVLFFYRRPWVTLSQDFPVCSECPPHCSLPRFRKNRAFPQWGPDSPARSLLSLIDLWHQALVIRQARGLGMAPTFKLYYLLTMFRKVTCWKASCYHPSAAAVSLVLAPQCLCNTPSNTSANCPSVRTAQQHPKHWGGKVQTCPGGSFVSHTLENHRAKHTDLICNTTANAAVSAW